jgi:hypothetical protein
LRRFGSWSAHFVCWKEYNSMGRGSSLCVSPLIRLLMTNMTSFVTRLRFWIFGNCDDDDTWHWRVVKELQRSSWEYPPISIP